MSAEKDPFARFLKHYPVGHILFHEGDPGEEMYILRSGKVAIKKRAGDGDTVLAVMEKGDFFGEMAILERLPRSASAEVTEPADIIEIGSDVFGDMIKANPEIAIRMMRKYSIRLRETNERLERLLSAQGGAPVPEPKAVVSAGTLQSEALAYFISSLSGNVYPVFKPEVLIGRFDSVTGLSPEVDLSGEDASRNISRRHARLVFREGQPFIAEEIGTMNGTYLNGQRLANGVLTAIGDGDELMLCRLPLTFKLPEKPA